MINKLVVNINSLTASKIKKPLLYEGKFLVPKYSCLQNPWLGGYRRRIALLSVLCPQLNFLNPPPSLTKFLRTPLFMGVCFQSYTNTVTCINESVLECLLPCFHAIFQCILYSFRPAERNQEKQQRLKRTKGE
jgi:hypothetical protein